MKKIVIITALLGLVWGIYGQPVRANFSGGADSGKGGVYQELLATARHVKARDARLLAQRQQRDRDERAKSLLTQATSASDIRAAHDLSPRVVPLESRSGVVELVKSATIASFGGSHWPAMHDLVMRESGFNPWAFNKSSGACGLPQALPCSKMGGMEVGNQIKWMIGYIKARYGDPTNALAFHYQHNWY